MTGGSGDVVAEGVKWLAEWLEKTDPDNFTGVSIIIITVTKSKDASVVGCMDMVTNEPPTRVLAMLTSAMNRVLKGNAVVVDLPTGKLQS